MFFLRDRGRINNKFRSTCRTGVGGFYNTRKKTSSTLFLHFATPKPSDLFTTIFHRCHDQIRLLNQTEGTQEDRVGLTVTEILFKSSTKTL